MILELQRFIEFGPNWFAGEGHHTRASMVFEPILINTEYVATVRRFPVHHEPGTDKIEMVGIWMVDHGNNVVVDITYEEMRSILKGGRPGAVSTVSRPLIIRKAGPLVWVGY